MAFTDVNSLGLSPENAAHVNRRILQSALDRGGNIVISEPGIYNIDGTLLISSNTTLDCANGVYLRKMQSEEQELANGFTYVLINRGAFTKKWDEHIIVKNLSIIVNNVKTVERNKNLQVADRYIVPGLRGQLAFFYVRDLVVDGIRIGDLEPSNFGIHICTFEDIKVTNCIIIGKKDGVHLGRGHRFLISNCVFDTFDDAVALNAHDYDSSNPELGSIEDGVIEKCYDVNPEKAVGFFCRILAGAWVDWYEGMEVQKSDTVVSEGRLYRVFARPDGQKFISRTRPTHEYGRVTLDGIDWQMVQTDPTYEAAVRNVTFRDIFLYKPRCAFSVHFDHDVWSRSFYPGAKNPLQEQIVFDNVRVLHDGKVPFISAVTPIDSMIITNCSLRDNDIAFYNPANLENIGDTKLAISNCLTKTGDIRSHLHNNVEGKTIHVTLDGEKFTI